MTRKEFTELKEMIHSRLAAVDSAISLAMNQAESVRCIVKQIEKNMEERKKIEKAALNKIKELS